MENDGCDQIAVPELLKEDLITTDWVTFHPSPHDLQKWFDYYSQVIYSPKIMDPLQSADTDKIKE